MLLPGIELEKSMFYIFDTITVCPGELHEITSDEDFAWEIHNCGPGPVLVDDTVLEKGDITVVSGSGPITLLCVHDEKAVVTTHPGAL
jgi:hypothetical protein